MRESSVQPGPMRTGSSRVAHGRFPTTVETVRKSCLGTVSPWLASASAVKGVVKDLSKSYRLLGFEGASNPARSELVKSYQDGYRNMLHQEGVKVKRAKVFSEEKLNTAGGVFHRQGKRDGRDRALRGSHGLGFRSVPVEDSCQG
jgi:hypothetical protein